VYAVIFKAKLNQLDESYSLMAQKMRELAINEYACLEFTSCNEGDQEIAISYWQSLESIKVWKNNAEHLVAQALGKSAWYESYQVQVVEVLNQYNSA